jgi:hypothetical protein
MPREYNAITQAEAESLPRPTITKADAALLRTVLECWSGTTTDHPEQYMPDHRHAEFNDAELLADKLEQMSDSTQNMPENAGLDHPPCPISHKTPQFGSISAVSRISLAIEMGGRPYFVVLPHQSMLLLLNLATSMSDGSALKVKPAPEGFHFKTL